MLFLIFCPVKWAFKMRKGVKQNTYIQNILRNKICIYIITRHVKTPTQQYADFYQDTHW